MSRYPDIRAGQRITGALLQGMQFEEVVKQAATQRASNPNATADPDLQFELEANATYHVEWFIQYSTSSTAMFKTEWGIPSGASGLRRRIGAANTLFNGTTANNSSSDGTWTDVAIATHGLTGVIRYGDRPGSSQTYLHESGVVTTSNAGTLSFNWAQNASDSFATEVSAFSYGRLKRVA